jgi:hypothetical protein
MYELLQEFQSDFLKNSLFICFTQQEKLMFACYYNPLKIIVRKSRKNR